MCEDVRKQSEVEQKGCLYMASRKGSISIEPSPSEAVATGSEDGGWVTPLRSILPTRVTPTGRYGVLRRLHPDVI